MKTLLSLMFILIFATSGFSAEKKVLDWTEKDVVKYSHMVAGKFLDENTFGDPEEARTKISLHLAKAFQILKNEGIIYSFDVNALMVKDSGEIPINIEFFKDVDSNGMTITMIFHGSKLTKKSVIIG